MELKLSLLRVGIRGYVLGIASYSAAQGYARLGVRGSWNCPQSGRDWRRTGGGAELLYGQSGPQGDPTHGPSPTSSPSSSRPLPLCPSRNGTQLRRICKDAYYDFNLQETRDLPRRVEIKPVGARGAAWLGLGARWAQGAQLFAAGGADAGPWPTAT